MRNKVVLKKLVLAMCNCMISMTTLYMNLKNGGRPTKSNISRVLLILESKCNKGTKLKLSHRPFFLCSGM